MFLDPIEYGRRTDRELWEWHVKPAVEKSERIRQAAAPPAFEPQTPEEEEAALSMMMMMLPGKVMTRAEWEEQQDGRADAGPTGGGDPEGG